MTLTPQGIYLACVEHCWKGYEFSLHTYPCLPRLLKKGHHLVHLWLLQCHTYIMHEKCNLFRTLVAIFVHNHNASNHVNLWLWKTVDKHHHPITTGGWTSTRYTFHVIFLLASWYYTDLWIHSCDTEQMER